MGGGAKMSNVFDYVKWRGDLSFSQSKFCAADALILAMFTFIDFNKLGGGEDISFDAASDGYCPDESYDSVDFGLIIPTEQINRLFCESALTKRFGGIIATDMVERTDEAEGVQFAATTFHLGSDKMAIAFRGTDDSLVGWREDCCLAYLEQIPAQKMATEYLEKMAEKYPEKRIYVMGHSKGGNLTLYSTLKCSDSVARRILRAYCFDGPGVSLKMVESERFAKMKNRFDIILPQASYIGIMFERGEDYSVVQSDGKGLFQHDPFTWKVMGNDLVRLPELSALGRLHEARFRSRLSELSVEDRKIVADAIFEAIAASGIKTLSELREKGVAKVAAMVRTYVKNDKQKRELVRALLFSRH